TTRYCVADPSTLPAPPPLTTVTATDVPIDVLVGYERDLFPAPRPDFLAAWLAMPESVSQAVVDGDRLLGWGLRRACIEGHKIGPLFAGSPDVADALLRALAHDADGPLFVDVPEPNSEARALAARHCMTPVFSTVRMYVDGVIQRQDPAEILRMHADVTHFVDEFAPDVVHSHDLGPVHWVCERALRRSPPPFVVTVHTVLSRRFDRVPPARQFDGIPPAL